MPGYSILPLTLRDADLNSPSNVRVWQGQVAQLLSQITSNTSSASFVSGVLNGNQGLNGGSLNTNGFANNAVTTNLTIDAMNSVQVVANYVITGAINFTLTIKNVVLGATLSLRIVNSSGAGRTFTVVVNDASSNPYNVFLSTTSSLLQLNSGVSIGSGVAWNGIGIVNTVTPTQQIVLIGNVGV